MAKSVLAGAALATMAGIVLGGAMRPQLIFDGKPLGPQMMATGGGARANGPLDDSAAYANYSASIPDYVTGTDYVQPSYAQATYVQPAPPARQDRGKMAHNDEAPPQRSFNYARSAYDEPRTEIVYPSVYGGSAYEREAPLPPPPPEDDEPAIVG